ncbi:MAG TPA: hypothetical protein VGC99_08440, partial [Candidatus Tectomicrobia bacterium]
GPAPREAALELTARRTPPDVPQAAVQLTTAVPSETACERCAERTGLALSAPTAQEGTPAGAEGLTGWEVAPSREELRATLATVGTGQPWRPLLVRARAGAEVPTRPETATGRRPRRTQVRATRARWTGAGREATGVRFDWQAEERIVPVLSGPQVQPDEAAVRLGVMAAGARWSWTLAQALCPSAGERLADDHGREPIPTVATLPSGAHPEPPREGGEAALARLCWGEVHGGIWGRQRRQPTKAHAAAAIGHLIRDRQRPQARGDDRCARTGDSPLGSGGIASAPTFIGPVRLQRSGAWWDVTHATQLLALRGAKDHGTVARVLARSRERRQDRSGSTAS